MFYWATILFSNTLGTALGDFFADDSGLDTKGRRLSLPAVWCSSLPPISARGYLAPCFSGWLSFSLVRSARLWETCSPSRSSTAGSTLVASAPHWSSQSSWSAASCARRRRLAVILADTESGRLQPEVSKASRRTLEFGHLGRILARSPRFFRNVFSINTGLPDLASGPFCAEGVRPEGPRMHSPG